MRRHLIFTLLVWLIGVYFIPKSVAQEDEPDYVFYYLTQDQQAIGFQHLMRSEFDADQTPHEGSPILDFQGASVTSLPAISPDGEMIAFATTMPFAYSESGYLPQQIYSVSALGGDFRSISSANKYYAGLDWSPDGNHIAVFTNPVTDAIGFRLEILDAQGNPILSLDGPGSASGLPIAWTQDGTRLAMLASPGTQPATLHIVDTRTGKFTVNDAPIYAPYSSTVVNWSQNEQYLYFTGSLEENTLGKYSIIRYDVDTRTAEVFWDELAVDYQSTVLSPHKTELATIVQVDGGRWQLVVIDVDSGEIVQQVDVWPSPEYEYGHPVWSPDGAYIAFSMQMDFEGAAQVYVLDVVSGKVTQVTFNPEINAVHPQWLP
jgi:WD40 repeat protein